MNSMDFITRLALKNRLLHFLLIGISLCFFGGSGFFAYTQYESYHRVLHRDLTSIAYLTEANIGGSLVYDTDWVSQEVLRKLLEHNLPLDMAVLFLPDGTLYGSAIRDTATDRKSPPFKPKASSEHSEHYHELYFPVHIGGNEEAVGVLFMRANLNYIHAEMKLFYLTQLVALVMILLLTFGFGRKLQKVISAPYLQQQKLLEAKVAERTARLREEVRERKQVELSLRAEKREHLELIGKLEEAQNQLLQAEKMASIGQLAAGVAHEINNPVGFISSNLNSLRSYLDDLIEVLTAYGRADDALKEHPVLAKKIEEVKARVDIGFLVEDVPALLDESKDGVERVKKIIQDLKDFSRSDSEEYQLYDLHQGIESTLNLVSNEIKYKADVVKEFAELPEVFCCLPQINQVVLNLLVNAAQAIDDYGTITLRTGVKDDQAWIEVEDTGKGIADADLKRIFDPFFTTKPVGKGTGLGLSLSYGIVRGHGGEIEVHSELGVGSRFRVWLPLKSVALASCAA